MKQARRQNRPAVFLTLAAAFAITAVPAAAGGLGECARAEVPWRITMPDGTTREAGAIQLCLQQMYNPATGLHEVRLDGSSIGIFMSRAGESEGLSSTRPVLIFRRDADGAHTLVGYAMPGANVMQTFMLYQFGKSPRDIAVLGSPARGTTEVRVAALVD